MLKVILLFLIPLIVFGITTAFINDNNNITEYPEDFEDDKH